MATRQQIPVRVYNSVPGAEHAAEIGLVCVVVDALRASATVASLMAAGAERVFVVAEPDEARAVADELRRHEQRVWLVGERNGVKLPGYDRGNEPAVGERIEGTVVFTSTNCAACCLAAAGAPGLMLGTTVNATAVAQAAAETATEAGVGVGLVMGGFSWVPSRLNLEDLLACGAIIERGGMRPDNDAAKAAVYAYRYVGAGGLAHEFRRTEHGRLLMGLGREVDIEYCARVDVVRVVPVRERVVTVDGVRAVELRGRAMRG